MNRPFWHVRDDFKTVTPRELVGQMWEDDELNRNRSLATFSAEVVVVDKGLEIYVEPLQRAVNEKEKWNDDVRRRASIAMLIHAFNSFLARRHLLTHGYLTESRLFSRNTYESLCQALAFAQNEALAKKFYAGRQISPKAIHKPLSTIFSNEEIEGKEVFKRFADHYQRLAVGAHPTLDSFSLRTAIQSGGLQQSVPEDVVFGGLLQDDTGKISWLAFARSIADATVSEKFVFGEISTNWNRRARAYRTSVEKQISEDEAELDARFSD